MSKESHYSDYWLNQFGRYAKGVKTRQELYEAIGKLGPLPEFCIVGGGGKSRQEDDKKDFETAREQAKGVYRLALRIAAAIWKNEQDLLKPPRLRSDPFLGLIAVSAWCLKSKETNFTADDKLLAFLVKHPDWSVARLTEKAGVNRTHAYKCKNFKKARAILKADGKYSANRETPRGSKDGETGTIEAWQ